MITNVYHGFGSGFKDLPKEIAKGIGRGIRRFFTGREKCHLCRRFLRLKYLERDYRGRWTCIKRHQCEAAKKRGKR